MITSDKEQATRQLAEQVNSLISQGKVSELATLLLSLDEDTYMFGWGCALTYFKTNDLSREACLSLLAGLYDRLRATRLAPDIRRLGQFLDIEPLELITASAKLSPLGF